MESRGVYLGIATRLRGRDTGALNRTYLHSGITESLWCAVVESEHLFTAKLMHAVMLASMYGNPESSLSKGNDQVHEMYLSALGSIPYFGTAVSKSKQGATDELVEEWRKVNSGLAGGEAAKDEGRKEAEDARG